MMRKKTWLSMTAVVVMMASGAACGGGGAPDATVAGSDDAGIAPPVVESPLEACAWDQMTSETGRMGVNQLANISEAAIVGEVTAIGAARWNSNDGQKWCPPVEGWVRPIVYRDITVKVAEKIYGSERLDPRIGQEITVRSFGDGTPTGDKVVRFSDGTDLRDGQIDGTFDVGQTALLILSVLDEFPSEVGPELVNQVTGGWAGNWKVDRDNGDRAKSVQPERNVPLKPLINRLLKEREIGRNPERDVTTTKNPLADETSPDRTDKK